MLTVVNHTRRLLVADLESEGAPLRHLGILPPGGSLPVPETGLEGGVRLLDAGADAVAESESFAVASALDKADAMEAAKYEYRNLVMQRVFEGRTEQEMLAEQMTQARFTPQQAWFQEPAHRKDARLYELLKQPPPALPSRAADGAAPSGAIDAPDGGGAAAPPSDAAGGGPPKDPER